MKIIEFTNPAILSIMNECDLNHQFYTLRWFMLLLCQDLGINDSMRLWDSLLSAEGTEDGLYGNCRFQFVDFVAVALVQGVSVRILQEKDFAGCMQNLQAAAHPDNMVDVDLLLEKATLNCLNWMHHVTTSTGPSLLLFVPRHRFQWNKKTVPLH